MLGRFDATVDARLDAGFERAEQKYRNTSRVIAGVFAVIMAVIGGWVVTKTSAAEYFFNEDFVTALIVGIIAVPLAPIAKDLTSALGTGVKAFKSVRGG